MLLAPSYRRQPSTLPSTHSHNHQEHPQHHQSPQHHSQQQQYQQTHYQQHQISQVDTVLNPSSHRSQSSHPQFGTTTTSSASLPQEHINYENHPLFEASSSRVFNSNTLPIHAQPSFRTGDDINLMQTDHSATPTSWQYANSQLTPTSARGHHRESSLSSVGSAGPSSPYTHNTSHPQVLLPSDSAADIYYDGLPTIDAAQFNNHSNNYLKHDSYLPAVLPPQYNGGYSGNGIASYSADARYGGFMPMQKRQSGDDDHMMPAPEYAHSNRPSVASTSDSPATPLVGEDFEDQSRSKLEFRSVANTIPKLDRTMSDVYNDELYSPSFAFSTTPVIKTEPSRSSSNGHSDVFSQRLQAANNQHLSASSQPVLDTSTRGRSPFRQGSPLAPTSNNFGSPPTQMRMGSAQQMREQKKAESDARMLHEQLQRMSPPQTAPKTISPKDALLDYHESVEDAATPLFPPNSSHFKSRGNNNEKLEMDDTASQQSFGSMATSRRASSSAYSTSSQATPQSAAFPFVPPSVPGSVQVPQQYPFVPVQRRQASNMSSMTDRTPDFPSTLVSMESSSSEYVPDNDVKKPAGTTADSGTYTCTYHGCTLRFESPAKLQKHKREGHRQSAPLVGGAPTSHAARSDANSDDIPGMTSEALLHNSQAGPHKCERINPSTGKPCNTIFSRPYDLTRHEDTIHNARKQKVRCHLCTEEKTFSRNDALTRHMRVVHPEVDFPGKTRRRHD